MIAVQEVINAAATDLATIGSNLGVAHAVAALPTSTVLSATGDEVSTGVTHVLSRYARDYQALAGPAKQVWSESVVGAMQTLRISRFCAFASATGV